MDCTSSENPGKTRKLQSVNYLYSLLSYLQSDKFQVVFEAHGSSYVSKLRYRAPDPTKFILLLHITKSLKCDNVYKLFVMTPRRTYLFNINTLACSNAEI